MALYNRLKEINGIVGRNLLRSSNLTLVEYYNSVQNKNTPAGFFTPFLVDNGVDGTLTTVSEVLQRSEYFNILDKFLSNIQKNESFNKLKNTKNKDVLFTENGNVELLSGDTATYGYPQSSVLINMVEVNDNMTDENGGTPSDTFYRKYRLVGTINCNELAETAYVFPLGIVSNNDLTEVISVRGGSSNSTVSCTDTLFLDVTTPFNNDSYVTDVATNNYVSATNGFLSFDNTLTGPGDYYVFLTLSAAGNMKATVNLDHVVEVQSANPLVGVSFQTV